MVDLHSLGELEAYLEGENFFRAHGVVADVFLHYGLSAELLRTSAPPQEPCRLPLVACRIRPEGERPRIAGAYRVGDWERSSDDAGYADAIVAAQTAIQRGDVYQVNLVQHLSAPFDGDAAGLARALAPLRPLVSRPLEGGGWTIVSASPELFLARRSRRLWTKPIKGTLPLGVDPDALAQSEKNRAEHVMIVDLERNDLSRVCVPGTVRWPELLAERQLAGVTHLVATVEGELRPDVTLTELLEAVLPGGSVTGCPKSSALQLIAELEPVGRGASMGALGRVYANGDLDLALTIRTFAVVDRAIHLWVGGGIVWDSEADAEIEESWVKARPLLALA